LDENVFGYFVFDFFFLVCVAQHEEFHHCLCVVEVEAFHFEGKLVTSFEVFQDHGSDRDALMDFDTELVPVNFRERVDVITHSVHPEEIDLVG
jgi:hypothetical protein